MSERGAKHDLRVILRRQAQTIVLLYAGAAAIWIALSDQLLGAVVSDPDLLVELSVYKGFAFVAATAGLLYLLLRRTGGAIETAFAAVEHKERERALHEAERRRAEAIVESTEDAIISEALDGRIASWNPAAQRMFGYQAAEIMEHSIDVLIPSDRAAEQEMVVRRIRAGERIEQLETIRLRKGGEPFPVAVTYSPVLDADGTTGGSRKIVGVSKIVRDISERKRAEAAAEREQRFASSLIESMPGIFYLYDEQGCFLRWNENFERISGYSPDEIRTMRPLDFFAGEERSIVAERIAEVFERGESSVEASFFAKDGSITPHFFTGRRIILDGATCLLGVGVDISKRKRAEAALSKSEERYRTTLEHILEGCQILSFDWRYLYLNDAAAVQNRRPNSELLGQRLPDAWPGIESSAVFALLARSMTERVALHDEIEFAFPDGATGWFDVRAQPVPEGIFVLSIDISERKQAERALRELNESLERRVAERTVELDAARERAEAADRIKSAFLATMSHELRTPLNSIIGFTGMVLQGLAGPLVPEQSAQLGMVQTSARHLLELIKDVLDISKIEAGQLEVHATSFDLRELVERVAASIAPLAQKKGLAVRVIVPDRLGPMESDRRRVEQILLNLLNNAIKFTQRGEVSLTVSAGEGPLGEGAARILCVQVADTGIGMRQDDLSLLFQPFRQIDSGLQRQHEGTGLGLAICRRLTELLGGTITVESVWREGSVFTVELPMTMTGAR